jgi:hypothetical protein
MLLGKYYLPFEIEEKTVKIEFSKNGKTLAMQKGSNLITLNFATS